MSIDQTIANLQALKLKMPKIALNEMVNNTIDNIRAQVDIRGRTLQKRKPGSVRDSSRNILIDTGDGLRSIERGGKTEGDKAVLTANDYMVAHNEGVNKTVSVRSRKGRSFSRKMNLPQRQVAGESKKQTERIEKLFAQQIIKAVT